MNGKKLFLNGLLVLTVACFAGGLVACGGDDDGGGDNTPEPNLQYELVNGSYKVTGIEDKSATKVVIPAQHEGKDVTTIGRNAFESCNALTDITIPETVTKMESSAFVGCMALENVTYEGCVGSWATISFGDTASNPISNGGSLYIGGKLVTTFDMTVQEDFVSTGSLVSSYAFYEYDKLTSVRFADPYDMKVQIGKEVFYGCDNLETVHLSENVNSILSKAFFDCDSLHTYTVDEGNETFKAVDGVLYTKDGRTLLAYPIGKTAETFEIPTGVTTIDEYAFFKAENLKQVSLSQSLETIGEQAFSYSGLTSVDIPDSVTTIEVSAFRLCGDLLEATVGDGVQTMSIGMFSGCEKLASVTIGANVTRIAGTAFNSCDGLTSVTFENKEGWSCAKNETSVSFTPADLTAVAVAEYIRGEYKDYEWTRA